MKTILLTGATDGIGLETAKLLVAAGHHVLMHGRNAKKLKAAQKALLANGGAGRIDTYKADLGSMKDVGALAKSVVKDHSKLDVLINNAGVFKTNDPITKDGLDVRFAVNALAPYLLTQELLPLLGDGSRIINVSSAAQAPVNLSVLSGRQRASDMEAYSQSKLAITSWSHTMGEQYKKKGSGPMVLAVNPGSLLGSKMVKEGFGIPGKDLGIGADILYRAALDDEFANAGGLYYDNDKQRLNKPHPDALNPRLSAQLVQAIEELLAEYN